MPESKLKTNHESSKIFMFMKPFIVQAVTGTVMAYVRQKEKIDPVKMCSVYLKIYLNMCWHSYNKKDDAYVVESIDKILSHKKIKGVVCVIHWIDRIGEQILKSLDFDKAMQEIFKMSSENRRVTLTQNVEIVYGFVTQPMDDILCDGDCDDSYDNQDIFIFEKQNRIEKISASETI
jgi:hypothetical protein